MSKRFRHSFNNKQRRKAKTDGKLSPRELKADDIHDILRELKSEVKETKGIHRQWQNDKHKDRVDEKYRYHAQQILKAAENLRHALELPLECVGEVTKEQRRSRGYDDREVHRTVGDIRNFEEQSPCYESRHSRRIEDQHMSQQVDYREMERKRKSEPPTKARVSKRSRSAIEDELQNQISHQETKIRRLMDQNEELNEDNKTLRNEIDGIKSKCEQLEGLEEEARMDNKRLNERQIAYTTEINKLRDQEVNLTKELEEKERLIEKREQLIEEKEELKGEKERLKGEKERLIEEKEQLKEENKWLMEETKQLKEEKEWLIEEKEQLIEERRSLIEEGKQQLAELQNRNKQLEEKEQLLSEFQVQLEKIREKEVFYENQIRDKDQSFVAKDQELQGSKERCSEIQGQLLRSREDCTDGQKKLKENEEILQQMMKENEYLQDQKRMLQENIRQSRDAEEDMRNTIDKLQRKLSAERASKEEALTRLSALAGNKLRDNNPGITDLSDPNRPMKLAEKVSELYDIEWTNAMEQLEDSGVEEEEGIKILLDMFVVVTEKLTPEERNGISAFGGANDVYAVCVEQGHVQMDSILNGRHLVFPDIDDLRARTESVQLEALPADVCKPIKDYRKQHSELADSHIAEIMRKRFLSKEGYNEDILSACDKYLKNCTKYAWMMIVQDPPVFMEWKFNHGDQFDNNKLRSYTKGGKRVDYVVWPVLYLHKGGPLLAKGVAQGMK